MPHDLRHDRILPPHLPLARHTVTNCRTHLEIGETTALATCHALELTSAEPEIPQAQLLGAGFQGFQYGRDGGPSCLWGAFGDLGVIQSFGREDVILKRSE